MSVSLAQLEALWSRLEASGIGQRAYVSLRLDGTSALDVHAALRAPDRNPCLIFELPGPYAIGDVEFEVGGMRCARVTLDKGQGLMLSLEDTARRDIFSKVCVDVVDYALRAATGPTLSLVLTRLESWRQFLRSVGAGMSRGELVGLVGELQLLRQFVARSASTLSTWRAPEDGLHDFENVGHALEVKTTLGSGSRVHISKLDQLSDAGLERLDLVHVRLYESAQGETVDEIVEDIAAALATEEARQRFSDALLRRGLEPAARRSPELRTSLQHIAAFHVADGFPRILRQDVPPAISEATYVLEISHLGTPSEPWSDVCDTYCLRNG